MSEIQVRRGSPMRDYHLLLSVGKPVDFKGRILAASRTTPPGDDWFARRWFEVAVFEVAGEGYMAYVAYFCEHRWADEHDRPFLAVKEVATLDLVAQFLRSYKAGNHNGVNPVPGGNTCFLTQVDQYCEEFGFEWARAIDCFIREDLGVESVHG